MGGGGAGGDESQRGLRRWPSELLSQRARGRRPRAEQKEAPPEVQAERCLRRVACRPDTWFALILRSFRKLRTRLLFLVQKLGWPGWILIFVLPCTVDLFWVILYFVERQSDVTVPGGPCWKETNHPTEYYLTIRSHALLTVQTVFAVLTLLVWMPFRVLYAGSYKFRHTVYLNIVVDLLTSVPFIVAIFYAPARDVYVPSFLRIWILRFELGFIISKRTLTGEIWLFTATSIAVAVTMIACFEWAQNNFPVKGTVKTLGTGGLREDKAFACLGFFSVFYWLIVTLSTVGYGDVVPINDVARIVTLITIAVFVVLLSPAVSRIQGFIKRSNDRKHAKYSARNHEAHLVVHGHMDAAILGHALYYFNPVRRARKVLRGLAANQYDQHTHSGLFAMAQRLVQEADGDRRHTQHSIDPAGYVVLMSENEITGDLLSQVDLGYQKSYLSLFEGTLLQDVDLERCQLSRAAAVFILPTLHVFGNNYEPDMSHGRHSDNNPVSDLIDILGNESKEELKAVRRRFRRVQRTSRARNRIYTRDYRTLLRAWSANKELGQEQLLVVVLFHKANEKFLLEDDSENQHKSSGMVSPCLADRQLITLCVDSFQQEMLAASCLVPGLCTVLTNLFIGEDREVAVQPLDQENPTPGYLTGFADDDDGDDDIDEEEGGLSRNDKEPWRPSGDSGSRDEMPLDVKESDFDRDASEDDGASRSESVRIVVESDEDGSQASASTRGRPRRRLRPSLRHDFVSARQLRTHSCAISNCSKEECPCEESNSPESLIRLYSHGVQHELEIMAVKENNPFMGWTRRELAVTLYRDFDVLLISAFSFDSRAPGLGDFDMFCDLDSTLGHEDHLVFIGKGASLDAVFNIHADEYGGPETSEGSIHNSRLRLPRSRSRMSNLWTSALHRAEHHNLGSPHSFGDLVQDLRTVSHSGQAPLPPASPPAAVSSMSAAPLSVQMRQLDDTHLAQGRTDLDDHDHEESSSEAGEEQEEGNPLARHFEQRAKRDSVSSAKSDTGTGRGTKPDESHEVRSCLSAEDVPLRQKEADSDSESTAGKGNQEAPAQSGGSSATLLPQSSTDSGHGPSPDEDRTANETTQGSAAEEECDNQGGYDDESKAGFANEEHRDDHQDEQRTSTKRRTLRDAYLESYEPVYDEEMARCGKGHIILCSSPNSPISYFVKALRRFPKLRERIRPVVWLVTEPPGEMVWDDVAEVEALYWVLGDPCEANDLIRAGIKRACDIVIVSDFYHCYAPSMTNSSQVQDPADVDRYIVQSHRTVQRLVRRFSLSTLRLHTHINCVDNGQYLHDSAWSHLFTTSAADPPRDGEAAEEENRGGSNGRRGWRRIFRSSKRSSKRELAAHALHKVSHTVWPILFDETYAAGETWSASSFFFILFSGVTGGDARLVWTLICKLVDQSGKHARGNGTSHGLRLVKIPPSFHGRTYETLVMYCVTRYDAICVGLFRGYGHGHASADYPKPVVLTNPAKSTIINPCDYLYLLGGGNSVVERK